MSRFLRFFFILSLLFNAVLIVWMGTKWMKRFQRQEWVLFQHRMTQTVNPSECFFLGDSQLDYLVHSGVLKPGIKLSNLAVPGYGVEQVEDVLKRLEPVSHPVRVILMVGVNDLRSDVPVEQVGESYSRLYPLMEEKFPQGEFVVLSLFPILESAQTNDYLTNDLIRQVNQQIKNWCDRQGFRYLDAFDLLSRNGQLPAEYTFDGLHLNLQGNQVLARFLQGYLE